MTDDLHAALLAELDALRDLDRDIDAALLDSYPPPPVSNRTRDTVRPGAKER